MRNTGTGRKICTASRSRGTLGPLKVTLLVLEWLLDRCDMNFISVCTMKTNLSIQESPSPEKKGLQTNSIGWPFSRGGWDNPKEAPAPPILGSDLRSPFLVSQNAIVLEN